MASRISFQQGLELLTEASLEELRLRADAVRRERHGDRVSFVLDSNPSYTNVCNIDCNFCAFYRHAGAKGAYTKSVDEVMQHLERARQAGLTTVLLQGGVNDALKIDYFEALVRTARERYPEIHPHFFSAVEIWNCARVSQLTVREVLERLYAAGQRTLPGGGAEILSERVRLQISPKKIGPGGWLEVHKTAHEVGFLSTATMMYGHIETPEDILLHLEALRQAQDIRPGFTAFVPWSYKRERTALRRHVHHWAGPDAYFRILACARLYLDNFSHIAASWYGEGKEIGMKALQYGADDFGGILLEENVHRATGWVNRTDHRAVVEMIFKAGFRPIQRDTFYHTLRTYEEGDEVEVPGAQAVDEADQVYKTS